MIKKILIIGILLLLVVAGLLTIYKQVAKVGKPTSTTSQPVFITPVGEKINISGVTINDFRKSNVAANNKADTLIVDNEKYQIVYLSQFNKFLITVLGSPFEEIRNEAEKEFLNVLGVSESDACKLTVEVNTTEFANPEFSGTAFSLSFCK